MRLLVLVLAVSATGAVASPRATLEDDVPTAASAANSPWSRVHRADAATPVHDLVVMLNHDASSLAA